MNLSVGRARLQVGPASLARYRQRATECRSAAERSPTVDERQLWLKLADDWLVLAQEVETGVENWRERAARYASGTVSHEKPRSFVPPAIVETPDAPEPSTKVRAWPLGALRVVRAA